MINSGGHVVQNLTDTPAKKRVSLGLFLAFLPLSVRQTTLVTHHDNPFSLYLLSETCCRLHARMTISNNKTKKEKPIGRGHPLGGSPLFPSLLINHQSKSKATFVRNQRSMINWTCSSRHKAKGQVASVPPR